MLSENIKERFENGDAKVDASDPIALDIEIARVALMVESEYLLSGRGEIAKRFGISKTDVDRLVRAAQKNCGKGKRRSGNSAAPQAGTQSESPSPEAPETPEPTEEEIATAYETAKNLLENANIIAAVHDQLVKENYAGDTRPALRIYVAISSRYTPQVLNIHRLAIAASGKNYSVDAVLPLFHEGAIYKLSASSQKALIYTSELFVNRIIIIDEMDSIPREGPAASAIRSIIHDAYMKYVVVEQNPESKEWRTRTIIKDGPTGLITTGTRPLEPQMATRMLVDTLPDDLAQTRKIMHAIARKAAGKVEIDIAARKKFVAMQIWLQFKGEHRAVVLFAPVLAEMVPAEQVRMRSDFRQLLSAISAVALLHQVTRERDDKGQVVAAFADYEIVRDLFADTFDVVATDTVSDAVREVVDCAAKLIEAAGTEKPNAEISVADLAKSLGLSNTAMRARVRSALRAGYFVNLESQKFRPARLILGVQLPEKSSPLPTVAKLREACEAKHMDISSFSKTLGEKSRSESTF